ncbi:hydroxyisourate hydrolase [Dasania marina]|uniref:hydroxyisourate hydrolase n=1 Tax=Dasania marina TaxID=471499 RepID=UPI0030DA71E2|tara:strand:- start:10284 stop:10628 length:345 start_codon:yes stop_codon:yes gene_type:complete
MSQITTHILDISRGSPARNVAITLSQLNSDGGWTVVGQGQTNNDGRIPKLCTEGVVLTAGTYQMHFDTASYFTAIGDPIFYPWADVIFNIGGDGQHYHIPLLLSPYGHSTYRGS